MFNRSIKSFFSTSDCCFVTSLVLIWTITVRCEATVCGILSVIPLSSYPAMLSRKIIQVIGRRSRVFQDWSKSVFQSHIRLLDRFFVSPPFRSCPLLCPTKNGATPGPGVASAIQGFSDVFPCCRCEPSVPSETVTGFKCEFGRWLLSPFFQYSVPAQNLLVVCGIITAYFNP